MILLTISRLSYLQFWYPFLVPDRTLELDYVSFRFWIGLWTALILFIMVAFDLSYLVCYITRFTGKQWLRVWLCVRDKVDMYMYMLVCVCECLCWSVGVWVGALVRLASVRARMPASMWKNNHILPFIRIWCLMSFHIRGVICHANRHHFHQRGFLKTGSHYRCQSCQVHKYRFVCGSGGFLKKNRL